MYININLKKKNHKVICVDYTSCVCEIEAQAPVCVTASNEMQEMGKRKKMRYNIHVNECIKKAVCSYFGT